METLSDSLKERLTGKGDTSEITDLCNSLGEYLKIGCDEISFLMFLSRAAGSLGLPLNLAIFSSDTCAENIIADRIANVVPESVHRVETISRFRAIAENEFSQTELVIARSLHDELFRYVCEITTRDPHTASYPSIWAVTDERSTVTILGPTLELMSMQHKAYTIRPGYKFPLIETTPSKQVNPSQAPDHLKRATDNLIKEGEAFAEALANFLKAVRDSDVGNSEGH